MILSSSRVRFLFYRIYMERERNDGAVGVEGPAEKDGNSKLTSYLSSVRIFI